MPLTAARRTEKLSDLGFRDVPVAAGVICYAGGQAVINATGYAAPATTATGLKAAGKFLDTVDNSGGLDGAETVRIECDSAYPWANSSGADEITQANVGDTVFMVDDETVALTDGGGTRSPAGEVFQVNNQGVYVLPTLRG
ncbi:MAG: hypothetical protein AAGH15_09480 [Myxococcota bacterium]